MLLRFLALTSFLFLAACLQERPASTPKNTSEKPASYDLAPSPFSMELFEIDTGFISPPFHANGETHLSYELSILSNVRTPFKLKQISIVDPLEPLSPIATFDQDYLAEHFLRHGKKPPNGDMMLEGNSFGIANLWVSLDKEKFPNEIYHRVVFELNQEGTEPRDFVVEVARISVPDTTDIVLGPPFPKGTWFYTTEGHRDTRVMTEGRASYAQRYAIDWAMFEADGTFVKGDISKNESYPTYGVELLAVADGTVISTHDGIEENNPETGEIAVRITRETLGGNYVFIDIGNGINAFYGHLIPGSLRVKTGDPVKKGDVIGLLGNSGNSDAAHLHFHLETATPLKRPLSGEGVPYHISEFDFLSSYSDEKMAAHLQGTQFPLDGLKPVRREYELPNGHGVLIFK